MKKFVLLMILLIEGVSSFSQVQGLTKKEISEIISMSKELNHLKNPNLVYLGDTLRFIIDDKFEMLFVVKRGQSQWSVLRNYMFSDTDLSIRYMTKEALEAQTVKVSDLPEKKKDVSMSIETRWSIVGLIILIILFVKLCMFSWKHRK